jgi:hypothetical protein
MSVKLVVLRTGETIISDIHEMIAGQEGQERVIGYYLNSPCSMVLQPTDEEQNEMTKMAVKLYHWIPFAKQKRIPIVSDWVVTVVDPVDNLKENYIETILEDKDEVRERKGVSFTESPDFGGTD